MSSPRILILGLLAALLIAPSAAHAAKPKRQFYVSVGVTASLATNLSAELRDLSFGFDAGGQVAYLKTFRLSAAQARRGYLLSKLAAGAWDLDATAGLLGTDRARKPNTAPPGLV